MSDVDINLHDIFTYPYDKELLLRKQKRLRRMLLERKAVSYTEKRIAILGGSTTKDIRDILELFLLDSGIRPIFYESEYNKYFEDAVFGNPVLDEFRPEIIIVFTSVVNILERPDLHDDKETEQKRVENEFLRYQKVWQSLSRYQAVIIQNNFDLPAIEPLGNYGGTAYGGLTRFICDLNERFAKYAEEHQVFYLHDLHALSSKIGLNRWYNGSQYAAYKFAMDYDYMPDVANSLAKIIRGILGKMKKCLVLDLDNTLWGGIIGDDGVENLAIGHETPTAEMYTLFQNYVKDLKERGIILAVCSKNDEEVAKAGFKHPDSVLQLDDFVAFYANWKPKSENLISIAHDINIGVDSLVFLDDNPMERAEVRQALPQVSVPEVVGGDVFSYIRAIEEAGYFEPISLSADDFKRNATYQANKKRQDLVASVGNYDEFLQSLSMEAEIASFKPIYYDRIAQLTNKSNQFNLTTHRYTRAEIEQIANDKNYITLYGRLKDRFGDNGLISVVIGEKRNDELHILLWLMSCRVLKRGMESAMLDTLVDKAKLNGCSKLIGYYYSTKKNGMVANLFDQFGFCKIEETNSGTTWSLGIDLYQKKSKFIKIKTEENE